MEFAQSECARVGFPVMIKASEGGGGKGVRMVNEGSEVASAYRQVQGEVPGSPIFIMKLASKARHLEVQLLADEHGNAIALNGRDCSVQRRFQKIIEEGPPTVVKSKEMWAKMEMAAVALAKEVGYANLGTVEYLYMYETDTFAFLELNPRLQVEHPVTEMITGVNLPATQLQVAMGIPLNGIPDIRRLYGRAPYSKEPLDFTDGSSAHPERIPVKGHCVAARITAENPDAGFQPTSGTIEEINFRSTPDVWGYFSVDSSGTVHEYADSQFGHLFAHGENRDAARKNMIVALKELSIRGEIRTTTEYIVQMLTSQDFIENKINTAWLDARLKQGKDTVEAIASSAAPELVATVGALVTFVEKLSSVYADFTAMLKRGQAPAHDMLVVEDTVSLIYEDVKYSLKLSQAGGEANSTLPVGTHGIFYVRAVDSEGKESKEIEAKVRKLSNGGYLVHCGGRSHQAYAAYEASGMRLTLDGQTCIFTKDYDPTRLCTDVAGKFVKQLVPDGAHVEVGQPFAEIEVMKMFMPVKAPEAGTVQWVLTEGAAMAAGDLMATMTLDHPELVKTATKFSGSLTSCTDLVATSAASGGDAVVYPNRVFSAAMAKLETVMAGYALPVDQYDSALEGLATSLADITLPCYEVGDALGPLTGRIHAPLHKALTDLKNEYLATPEDATAAGGPFAPRVLAALEAHVATLTSAGDAAAFRTQCSALFEAAVNNARGPAARSVATLQKLVNLYAACEREFNYADKPKPYNEVIKDLRKAYKESPATVFDYCRSHAALKSKNDLLCYVLQQIREANTAMAEAIAEKPAAAGAGVPGAPPMLARSESLTKLMHAASAQKVDGTTSIAADLNELAAWDHAPYARVALEARMLLIEQEQPSLQGRRAKVAEWIAGCVSLSSGIEATEGGPRARKMAEFLSQNMPLFDVLPEILSQGDDATGLAALELYLRKVYPLHNLRGLEGQVLGEGQLSIKFNFFNDLVSAGGAISASSSVADLATMGSPPAGGDGAATTARIGVFLKCSTFEQFASGLDAALSRYPPNSKENCLHVALAGAGPAAKDENVLVASASALLSGAADKLRAAGISRVTFLATLESGSQAGIPGIFTFRDGARVKGFAEDKLFRNVEPSYAYHLDILRLRNFDISLSLSYRSAAVGNVQVYRGAPFPEAAQAAKLNAKEAARSRFFVRSVSINQADDVPGEVGRMFLESLAALNTATSEFAESGGDAAGSSASNHIFLHVVANQASLDSGALMATVEALMKRHRRQVSRLGVAHVEVRAAPSVRGSLVNPLRLLASDPTGTGIIALEGYEELPSPASGRVLKSLPGEAVPGIWDGCAVSAAYEVRRAFEQERAAALASSDTLYCYDFLDLFKEAVKMAWAADNSATPKPAVPVEYVELVIKPKGTPIPMRKGEGTPWNLALAESGGVEMVEAPGRPIGQNDVGMVAWLVTLRTPEYPSGRQMVLISNDITFVQGSFGTREDWVFKTASEYARAHGLPRLYLAANSGARIGMANKLKAVFKVCWNNADEPTQGYKYLYLNAADNAKFVADGSVKTEVIMDGNEERFKITDVVGDFNHSEPDLGVENLRGSGMIAGETSAAYDEIFTLTVVTGRSVGIGAYLVRLGQRTIQKTEGAPIILTGYQALNKLMGKEIYTTNDQLGGGGLIMYPNGVTHLLADDHLDSIVKAVKWLSYVPKARGAPLPITDIKAVDSVERLVEFTPTKSAVAPYDDPRYMLDGVGGCGDANAPLGFFDKGSFTETLNEWAQTVVVGRARLGGIPMGVIVTENRTRTCLTPADPADPNSSEMEVMQAGGVWFPDSAHKTAQALQDFKGEDLPVIIFANWRGFSGGQRDMFLEVLKYGAMIVDALVASEQPIFVYIPPHAELRGGAWVVVDSTINPSVMEFFAAEDSRGGVLEPTGLASIKYRGPDLLKTMHRTDFTLVALDQKLADGDASAAALIKARERKLMPIFQQIAVQFADLHDTPARMEATGVIKSQVDWKASRAYFYWRLRRRLAEFQVRKQLCKLDGALTPVSASKVVESWLVESGAAAADWADSRKVLAWFSEKASFLRTKLEELKAHGAAAKVQQLALDCPEGAAAGVVAAFGQMDAMQREVLRQKLAAIK